MMGEKSLFVLAVNLFLRFEEQVHLGAAFRADSFCQAASLGIGLNP